jgi:predicted permease
MAEHTGAAGGAQPTTNLSWVHGPYFETFGVTLKRGRFFAPDEHMQNRFVVIVNEKLAAMAWPGQDPIGKRLKWGVAASQAPWLTVVGVIGNITDGAVGAEPGLHAYEPFRQLPDFFLSGAANQFGRDVKAAVLADRDPRALSALVREAIAALDPVLAVESVLPMHDRVTEVFAPQRFGTRLVAVFAAIALLLAVIGLYGLLAFTIGQRQREIAVRMALGAERQAVIRMVIAHGARLVAIGLVVGFAGSIVAGRVVSSLLYRTNPYDPATFAVVAAVLAVAAFIACALPAWRAARFDPMVALRAE